MLAVGDTAPAISLRGTDGKPYSLDGRSTLAVFFKTTCPTCQYAWPFYDRLYRAYHPAGLQVWGISQHDKERTVRFGEENGSSFPLLLDEGFQVSKQYDPEFVPTLFLIDPERRIVRASVSWNRQEFEQLGREVAERLGVEQRALLSPGELVVPFKAG